MVEAALVGPDVESAQRITESLDRVGKPPKAVLWVYSGETDTWRLWIVPSQSIDKHKFYKDLSVLIFSNAVGIGIGDVQLMRIDDPVIQGLKRLIRVDGVSSVRSSNNVLNGVFLPDAVIIRMAV